MEQSGKGIARGGGKETRRYVHDTSSGHGFKRRIVMGGIFVAAGECGESVGVDYLPKTGWSGARLLRRRLKS